MIYIHSIGHFRPENEIDNKFLENLDIGTNDQWIIDRVGIKSRRTVLDLGYIIDTKNQNPLMANEASLYTNAQTGAMASLVAIEKGGIKLADIGMVIAGGCSPQNNCPTESCTIANELGLEVPSFDLNSSCSSIGAQIHFLNMLSGDQVPEYILIINPENSTRAIDYSDRSAAVLWGDCTTATIVSTKHPSRYQINNTFIESSPKGHDKVVFEIGGHFRQDGKAVQKFAIKKSLAILKNLRDPLDSEVAENIKYIGHQANLMMLESVCRMADIKEKNHYYNVDNFGNCGAAGSVSVLGENMDKLKTGDELILAVVGAGLTWSGFQLSIK